VNRKTFFEQAQGHYYDINVCLSRSGYCKNWAREQTVTMQVQKVNLNYILLRQQDNSPSVPDVG